MATDPISVVVPFKTTGSNATQVAGGTSGGGGSFYGPGDTGNGGSQPPNGGNDVDIAKLGTSVAWLKGLLGGLAATSLAVAIGLWQYADARFDKVDGPLRDVQIGIGAQTETLKAIDARLGRIEQKMDANDDHAQASNRDE